MDSLLHGLAQSPRCAGQWRSQDGTLGWAQIWVCGNDGGGGGEAASPHPLHKAVQGVMDTLARGLATPSGHPGSGIRAQAFTPLHPTLLPGSGIGGSPSSTHLALQKGSRVKGSPRSIQRSCWGAGAYSIQSALLPRNRIGAWASPVLPTQRSCWGSGSGCMPAAMQPLAIVPTRLAGGGEGRWPHPSCLPSPIMPTHPCVPPWLCCRSTLPGLPR
ncbi:unnamed protein product [Eretmochelys imbricata]